MIRLAALHLVGNALLLWGAYYWLGVGESDVAHLAWSALVAAAIVAGAVWLHATALVFFDRERPRGLGGSAATAARHLVPLFVLALVAMVIYSQLPWWDYLLEHPSFVIGSYATMHLGMPVPPSGVLRVFHWFIWLLEWLVVPAVLFRLAARAAVDGWAGLGVRASRLRATAWWYWPAVCGLLLCAIWVPLKLEAWNPPIERFAGQAVSFAVRLGVAYLLFVAALLALEFVTHAGRPRRAQPSTVASP